MIQDGFAEEKENVFRACVSIVYACPVIEDCLSYVALLHTSQLRDTTLLFIFNVSINLQ